MTDAASPHAGDRDTREQDRAAAHLDQTPTQLKDTAAAMTTPGSESLKDGYMQVIHAPGSVCETLAALVAEQCQNLGIDVDVTPIRQVRLKKLYRYTTLFLIVELPEPPGSATIVKSFTKVFEAYRKQSPKGWQWTGPVHLLLSCDPEEVDHPALAALRKACMVRIINDPSSVGNLFDVFYRRVGRFDPEESLLRDVQRDWQYLLSWGVPALADVPVIRRIIEDRIEFYSNPRFKTTSRPLSGVDYNRLELVLFAPELKPTVAKDRPGFVDPVQYAREIKNFTESGATVVRKTLDRIKEQYPDLKRPENRAGTKDNQPAFRRFYDALLRIDTLPTEFRHQL